MGTNVGDVKAMLAAPNQRFVAEPADEAQFAEMLAQLIRDISLRAELGRANRDKCCESFSKNRMLDAHVRLYCDMLGL